MELLSYHKTLCLHIWFGSLENLLSLIIFATLITDLFIYRNWSVITSISTSNWVLTCSVYSSSDFGVNGTLWSSSGVWTRRTHLSSHKLWSTLAVIFGLPENRIFLGLLLWFLLSSIHILNISPSSGSVMFASNTVLPSFGWVVLCSSRLAGYVMKVLRLWLKWICCLAHVLFYFALKLNFVVV